MVSPRNPPLKHFVAGASGNISDTHDKQPPKRKSGGSAESGAPGKAARQSKLAKENDITAQEEAEIKEAFSLFAEPMDGEKEGVIPIDDVRRAMM